MALKVSSLLNQISGHFCYSDPGAVLYYLDSFLKEESNHPVFELLSEEGIGISLCYISFKKRYLLFAGSRQCLFYVKNGEVRSICGDSHSPGSGRSEDTFFFTNHELSFDEVESFYLSTRGFFNQMKLKMGDVSSRDIFRIFFTPLIDQPLEEQKAALLREPLLQIKEGEAGDDITVLGFRVR